MGRLLALGFCLGILDLYLLYRIGIAAGFWPVIAILFLPGYFGLRVALRQGLQCAHRIGEEMTSGRNPSQKVAETFLVFVSGVLLLMPGPVSSVLGLLMMIPGLRRLVAKRCILRIPKAGTVTSDSGEPVAAEDVFVRVVRIGEEAPAPTPGIKDVEAHEVDADEASGPRALPGPGADESR